jgi:hypothetical protein
MSSDPLFSRLRDLDPARHVAVDADQAHALLARINAEISVGRSGPRSTSPRARVAQLASVVPAALVLVVCVAVVLLITQVHARPPGAALAPGQSRSVGAERRALVDLLGVLRRPQTPSDRRALARAGLAKAGLDVFGRIDPGSARLATTTAWGSRVLLVLADRDGQEQLIVSEGHSIGGAGTPALIRAGKSVQTQGWGASYAGGSTGIRESVVVPDGVARVTFVLPQTAAGSSSGPSYATPLRISVKVHGNVAAFEARRPCCEGGAAMVWYAADGQVIKQIGHISATVARPLPTATPATAASRAAQHDPATPNPVTVTPVTGGPRTTVRISWRLLLTGAAYAFTPVGPQGADCYGANAIPGGLSGGTSDVRGQTYGETFSPPGGEIWCPGSYRVSVSVLALGADRPALRPTPRPFASIRFTITR